MYQKSILMSCVLNAKKNISLYLTNRIDIRNHYVNNGNHCPAERRFNAVNKNTVAISQNLKTFR